MESATSDKKVSFGAVVLGAVIILGFGLLFFLFAQAVGIPAVRPSERGVQAGAVIYAFASSVISFFLGGYVASRFSGGTQRGVGALQGLCAWAIVLTLTGFLVTSGLPSMVSGATKVASLAAEQPKRVANGTPKATGMREPPSAAKVQRNLEKRTRQLAGTARKITEGGAWSAFLNFLVGGLAAMLGGMLAKITALPVSSGSVLPRLDTSDLDIRQNVA